MNTTEPVHDKITHTDATGLRIKDSGERQVFETGANRDRQAGKGRFDLLPPFALLAIMTPPSIPKMDLSDPCEYVKEAVEYVCSYLGGAFDECLDKAARCMMVALEIRERDLREEPPFSGLCADEPEALMLPYAVEQLSKLYEAGCLKYGDRNWEKGIPLCRYLDSGLRHAVKFMRGERDEDHLLAAAWNLMCCLDTRARIEFGYLPASLDDVPKLTKQTNQ